jgi:hypothetical protein
MKRHISFVCFFILSVLIALPCKVLFAQGGGSQYGPPQLKIIVDPETPVEEPGGEDPPPPCGSCYIDGTKPCDKAPGTPCVDQQCVYDADHDMYYCLKQLLPLEGRIGYYDPQETYPIARRVDATLKKPHPVLGKCGSKRKTDAYCWIKKGCPTTGCSEVCDPDNPSAFIWYCSDPAQSGQKEGAGDDASVPDSKADDCDVATSIGQ